MPASAPSRQSVRESLTSEFDVGTQEGTSHNKHLSVFASRNPYRHSSDASSVGSLVRHSLQAPSERENGNDQFDLEYYTTDEQPPLPSLLPTSQNASLALPPLPSIGSHSLQPAPQALFGPLTPTTAKPHRHSQASSIYSVEGQQAWPALTIGTPKSVTPRISIEKEGSRESQDLDLEIRTYSVIMDAYQGRAF